jgi:hypothetical protein
MAKKRGRDELSYRLLSSSIFPDPRFRAMPDSAATMESFRRHPFVKS